MQIWLPLLCQRLLARNEQMLGYSCVPTLSFSLPVIWGPVLLTKQKGAVQHTEQVYVVAWLVVFSCGTKNPDYACGQLILN